MALTSTLNRLISALKVSFMKYNTWKWNYKTQLLIDYSTDGFLTLNIRGNRNELYKI